MNDSNDRLAWVDAAKGLGIILVVFGHVERGVVKVGLAPQQWLQSLDEWIYLFHMPLFFALSGIFAHRANAQPWGKFLKRRFLSIMYPYFIWATLQTSIQVIMGGRGEGADPLSDLLAIPYSPPMQFWFLYSLFIVCILHRMLSDVIKSPQLVFLASLALYPLREYMAWGNLYSALKHLPYYAFAAACVPYLSRFNSWSSSARLTSGVVLLSCLGVSVYFETGWKNLPLALVGTVGAILIAGAIDDKPKFEWLRQLGRASLEIYLVHTLATASFRMILMKLGVSDTAVHLSLGFIVGIAAPLVVLALCKRFNFPYLFQAPTLARRSTESASSLSSTDSAPQNSAPHDSAAPRD